MATSVLLAGCAGAGPGAPSGSGGLPATGQTCGADCLRRRRRRIGRLVGAVRRGRLLGADEGGDRGCHLPAGSRHLQQHRHAKDADTGKTVVCQHLVTFGGGPEIVGVAVSLLSDTEFGNRAEVSIVAPPEALSGMGTEAWLVQPLPGLFEVWVSGTNGMFKVGAQAKTSAIALAILAAGRA